MIVERYSFDWTRVVNHVSTSPPSGWLVNTLLFCRDDWVVSRAENGNNQIGICARDCDEIAPDVLAQIGDDQEAVSQRRNRNYEWRARRPDDKWYARRILKHDGQTSESSGSGLYRFL